MMLVQAVITTCITHSYVLIGHNEM